MNVPLQNRQRLLAIIAGAAVALLLLDTILFTPLTKLWQTHSAEIVTLQKKVREGRGLIANEAALNRRWSEMQTNALPKDPSQAEQDVISAFERWRGQNNIELGSIRPQWKRGGSDRYSLLECRVDATGSLASLSRFLWELEHSPLALRVDSIELSSRDDYGSKMSLGLVVSGLRFSPLERKL
ncbi:MAG: hypothetical protein HZA93_13785 [Verrucomicrobia bacterium]|nr:hypothetical protein [Verrucomicrobiota bacterium]